MTRASSSSKNSEAGPDGGIRSARFVPLPWCAGWSIALAAAISAAALVILGGCGSGQRSAGRQETSSNGVPAALTDHPAAERLPDFSVKDMSGREISPDMLRGKVALIDFWATWCPPCRKEIPHFNELYSKHKDQGIVIIGLALDQKSADVTTFLRQIPIEHPIAIATPELQQQFGGIEVYPTAFLVNRNGGVVKKYLGYTYPEEFDHDVTALLNAPASGKHSP